jgi:hypothetical protein
MSAKTYVLKHSPSSSSSSDELDELEPLLGSNTAQGTKASLQEKPLPQLRLDDGEHSMGRIRSSKVKLSHGNGVDLPNKDLSPLLEVSDDEGDIPCVYIPS